jgi:four helix bundle protein
MFGSCAARSGPDLIAEGYYRFNPREFHRFLNDAKGSLGEVRNQLMHANDERFIDDVEFRDMSTLANRAIGAANALQKYLRSCPSKFTPRPKQRTKQSNRANEEPASEPEPRTRNRHPEPQNQEPRTVRSTFHRF